MNWIKRSLRAFAPSVSQPRRRARLAFDALEDRSVPTAAGVVSGSVFLDNNINTIREPADILMPGVKVDLSGASALGNDVSLTTTTASDGTFQFLKLEPGTYQVSASNSIFQPAVAGVGNLGGTADGSKVQTITLTQGQTEANLRFGLPGLSSNAISLRLFLNSSVGQKSQLFGAALNNPGSGKAFADNLTASQNVAGTGTLEGDVLRDGSTAGVPGIQVELSGVNKTGIPFTFAATTDSAGHYKFTKLPAAAYFINVVPSADFRAAGSTVGSLGGSSSRSDQLATTVLADGASGTGYNFALAPFVGNLDAALANDVGNGSITTFSDGVKSGPSIRGRLVNPAGYANLEARFTAGASTNFVSVKDSLAVDGSFVLSAQTLRDIFGGGFPDGAYTVEIRATPMSGAAITKSVSFNFKSNGPTFLSAYSNISNSASAANTTLLLAGGFTDPDITDSSVTIKATKGTTPVDINVELFDKDAPRTVANFFNYFDRYALSGGALFHRLHLESGLKVLQGGGFNFNETTNTPNTTHITEDPAIVNEFSQDRPNVRGTIAMAKTSDPNSATSEFFFNLDDADATTLNVNNSSSGGFTVFGKVQSDADLAVLDDLAKAPIKNTGQFNELPLLDGNTVDVNNLERIKQVVINHRDDELTYTATSSNPAAVTATVGGFQGNQLTLDYQAAGTSTITVTATDKTGNMASQTFIVTVT